MIKQLIEDVTFERISISQALTRAKIIAYKISNTQFKDWINSEINGYSDHKNLPEYRRVSCDVFAEISNPFYGVKTIPFDVTNLDKKFKDSDISFYKLNVLQSISTIEEGLDKSKNEDFGYEYLHIGMVQMLKGMVPDGELISAVKRRIQYTQLTHILNITKQKLLDTLLELNDAFPNLENEFKNDSANTEKTQNIITQNIFGNYANSNIGVGEDVSQSITVENKVERLIEEIKELGVSEEDAQEVKEILKDKNKKDIGKKVMSWIGKLSTKAIEKGIELQIPLIIDKLSDFI